MMSTVQRDVLVMVLKLTMKWFLGLAQPTLLQASTSSIVILCVWMVWRECIEIERVGIVSCKLCNKYVLEG